MTATAPEAESLIAAGSQVAVRDAEWLVTQVQHTPTDGLMVRCIGTSGLVKDTEATFFTALDRIEPLQPQDTVLVSDDSPRFRTSRLHLEALIRKTPVPAAETGLAVAHRQLLDPLDYQQRAVHKALTGLRPRLLIADAVGLGKTLEVGMILSELIRRGRGERILVVTPQHILEQFQHELWTRFAIPLVRLDSEGIQRVRREIPGNRNPFTHYKRAIISIDTLKNAGRYRHHLEGIRWDAVVIDECHNLVNRGTLNNQLARVLAPRTEALLLTSATPHNGEPEVVRRADPPPRSHCHRRRRAEIDAEAIDHLYVRRHKHHDDVSAEVAANWAERASPAPILVILPRNPRTPSMAEIADTWTHPASRPGPHLRQGPHPVPLDAVQGRPVVPPRPRPDGRQPPPHPRQHRSSAGNINTRRPRAPSNKAPAHPRPASRRRRPRPPGGAVRRRRRRHASKLQALVDELRTIGVGPRSRRRPGSWCSPSGSPPWNGWPTAVPDALGLKRRPGPGPPRRQGRHRADAGHRRLRPRRPPGPPPPHRRHGRRGRQPPPPVPPPDPLRPAVVADHDRAAQRPHRPLRPDRPTRDPGPAPRARTARPRRRHPGPHQAARAGAPGPQGLRRLRVPCSASTTSTPRPTPSPAAWRDGAGAEPTPTPPSPPSRHRRELSICWPSWPAAPATTRFPWSTPQPCSTPTSTSSTKRFAAAFDDPDRSPRPPPGRQPPRAAVDRAPNRT